MSLSINNISHSRNYAYTVQSSSSQTTAQTDTSTSSSTAARRHSAPPPPPPPKEERTQTDSAEAAFQISPEMLRYLAGLDSEDSEDSDAADTDTTYSVSMNSRMLTTDQKKSMLTDLQADLSAADTNSTSSDSPPGLEELLSSIQDELAEFDASTASDDEVSALFENVLGTIDSTRPPLPPPPPPQDEQSSGVPPMLRAMGGITPPYMLDSASTEETEETDSTEASADSRPELTTDQKKEWLTKLQSSLQSLSEAVSNTSDDSDPTEELRKLLQNRLSGFNADSSTDSEVNSLFSSIADII